MKQVHFSRVIVAVVAFAAAFARAQGDAKGAPPAWVVSSTGTIARAEAGDVGAMEEIADGYRSLTVSPNTESTDDERVAMIQAAAKWMHRRAKVIIKTPEVQALAEKGDEPAIMDLARSYLFLAAARTMEAKGEERKVMFQKARDWLRRRAEKTMAKGNIDVMMKVSDEFIEILGIPEYDFNEDEWDERSDRLSQFVTCTGGGWYLAVRRWWPVRIRAAPCSSSDYEQAEDDEIPTLLSDFVLPTVNNVCITQDLRMAGSYGLWLRQF